MHIITSIFFKIHNNVGWLKILKKNLNKSLSLKCRKQCFKTIRNQAWLPPLNKNRNEVYNQTHASHLLFFFNYPPKGQWLGPPLKLPQKARATKKPCLQVVREIPIHLGSLEGGSHKAPSVFPPQREHMCTGTSKYVTVSSFSFPHSFLLVFFNFLICTFPPCVFWIYLISRIKESFHSNMGTKKYSRISPIT